MDFATKSFRKNETLTSWTLLQRICPHFWAWLLNTIEITPKSEDKYVAKVFNWSEFHFSEMTLLQNPYFNKQTQFFEFSTCKNNLWTNQKDFFFLSDFVWPILIGNIDCFDFWPQKCQTSKFAAPCSLLWFE